MTGCTFGLFLNMGANLAATPEGVFEFTRRQADAADALGYHDLWVTEHHFIRFGLDPDALSAAAYLLGRTRNVRVGTAVVLAPLYHPTDLAERAALIDQLSDGRLDLGLGRGGYLIDYDAFDIDIARWDHEPETTASSILELWHGRPAAPSTPTATIQPAVRSAGAPPLYLATTSDQSIRFASNNGLALQHYFATPTEVRLNVEQRYRDAALAGRPIPAHVHTLIVIVTDGHPRHRQRLADALTTSFHDGDHPHVPQAGNRHVDPTGQPLDRSTLARNVAETAIIGSPDHVVDQLAQFIDTTGAQRLVLYQEAIGDTATTMTSIERFANEVAPQL